MEKLNSLTINKKRYPYKCDLYVLEQIQKEYSDMFEFEHKLKGLIPRMDKNGNRIYKEDGSPDYTRTHFDLHALNLIFPLIVNEGIEIEGQSRNKEITPVEPDELIRTCDIPLYDLWALVVAEYDRCMFGKK